MARRILSADAALKPVAQASLNNETRTSPRSGFMGWLQERWAGMMALRSDAVLFDWEDRTELMNEIAFVNEARERLDEASTMVAPSMLRIVLTVQSNLPDASAQRAFLAEHVDWDVRRISELCIVADNFGLLEPDRRQTGREEIRRYGWSNALKLAYIPDPADRADVWDRARNGKSQASYRTVLEEIRRFRERKMIAPPAREDEVTERLSVAREHLAGITTLPADLSSPEACRDAFKQVAKAHQELGRLKRALKDRIEASETEAMAATV
ncbi:MAG TPA: hypothetical protein VLB09_00635 [Nitrospiria bacterium]|nr:hypothetical protein [Nitrospiria bacterium]